MYGLYKEKLKNSARILKYINALVMHLKSNGKWCGFVAALIMIKNDYGDAEVKSIKIKLLDNHFVFQLI